MGTIQIIGLVEQILQLVEQYGIPAIKEIVSDFRNDHNVSPDNFVALIQKRIDETVANDDEVINDTFVS